ncbi:splicing factor 3B subunit 10-domain-containing protein, partial [Dissophora ornata]
MDRSNLNSQLEHLQSKYVGTGHADTSKYEWGVNQARDTYASYIGHYPMLSYFAVAENESIARVKFNITEVNVTTIFDHFILQRVFAEVLIVIHLS